MPFEPLIDSNGDPAAPIIRSLLSARRELASAWLSLSDAEVKSRWNEGLRKFQRALLDCGIRDQLLFPEDATLVDQIMERMKRPRPPAGAILAGALYCFPHHYGRVIPFDEIPDFLMDSHLRQCLAFPLVFRNEGESEQYRRYLMELLEYLIEKIKSNPDRQLWRGISLYAAHNLNLVPAFFSGANLRELMKARGRLIQRQLMATNHPIDFTFLPRSRGAKVRLGILASSFLPHTETFATLPVYRHLDRQPFHITLLSLTSMQHPLHDFCASLADEFVVLPGELSEQVRKIRQIDLDILLVATNVSAVSSAATLLAAHRLARMQVASVCSCVTTGLRNIDCYLSGSLSEPAGAEEHYTEKLLLIDGPAHCYDFGTEAISPAGAPALERREYGISPETVVFASGANCCKILPELIETWGKLLAAVPDSRLVLYPFNPNWSDSYPVGPFLESLGSRLRRHGVSADRLLVFPNAPQRSSVYSRLKMADVYLDSYPFAGATSLLDPLALAIPAIVMDGKTFRSLVGPALLRDLKLDEFIAPDERAYVDLAVRLGTDANYRKQAKDRFAAAMAAGPRFLDGKWYAGQVGQVLLNAWRERGHG